MFITVGELDAQLFALGFNAVADRQIVRIVDLQLLLVAVDSQNMVLVDCTCLEFTGTTGLVLQLFGDLENAMFVSSFTFNVGSSFKTLDTVARDTPASIAMSFSVAMFTFFTFPDVRPHCRGSAYRVTCFQ
ncbi:Uncharacterised protein [Escherichia coli]|uniref:Uncharacterized protein n=1 Tax=Escherichia coli TaxID=562 RepID=A0A376NV23_ECOLX|nr:Uncharacterised protein [Escherichia coli]